LIDAQPGWVPSATQSNYLLRRLASGDVSYAYGQVEIPTEQATLNDQESSLTALSHFQVLKHARSSTYLAHGFEREG
jgi:hypothetical protein